MKNIFQRYSPFMQAMLFVAIGVVAFVIISIGISLYFSHYYPNLTTDSFVLAKNHPISFIFLKYLPFQVGFLLIPGIIYWRLSKPFQRLSSSRKLIPSYIWAFLLFLCIFLLLPLFTQINVEVTNLFGVTKDLQLIKSKSDTQMQEIVGKIGTRSFYFSLLVIGLITGIAEELAFRRFLFHHFLLNTQRLWLSIFASAFIFALLHFNYIQLLPLLIFGTALAMMYYKTRSILPGIIAHAFNNCINLYWLASGTYPEWLNTINPYTIFPSLLLLACLIYWFIKKDSLFVSVD